MHNVLNWMNCFKFKWWSNNTINWLDRNVCTWNEQRSFMQGKKSERISIKTFYVTKKDIK